MKKKKRSVLPPIIKPPQFHTTPFNILKGVVATTTTSSPEPPVPLTATPTVENDNLALFLQAMDDVRRLDDFVPDRVKKGVLSHKRTATSSSTTVVSPVPQDAAARELFLEEIGRLKLEVKFTETMSDEDELKPLSGNRLKQLKRGVITIDYQLDLHGLTRDEALTELPRFLRTARLKGQAAVLVITGKGNHSAEEPVLQQAVAAWLRNAGRELVVEFAPAPREMGGSGAFVLFLRKTAQHDTKS